MDGTARKKIGAFYTPPEVARELVGWVVRRPTDRLLDPACGDGRFLAAHRNSVGVDCDVAGIAAAAQRKCFSAIHAAEFFSWAENCRERFDCAAGNPPFIRYQLFSGAERQTALRICARLGANFSGLASSWAPFLAVCAALLKPGGRMAFLVPAEVGHAPYARPLISYLAKSFDRVLFLALRRKLFSELSEDVWVLYADGFGGKTNEIQLAAADSFSLTSGLPRVFDTIPLADWESWNFRLRPFLLHKHLRNLYQAARRSGKAEDLGDVARIGIGYVTGANDFFHLHPSAARRMAIPHRYLLPTVRRGRYLTGKVLTRRTIEEWKAADEPVLLLRLPRHDPLEKSVRDYLDSPGGMEARSTFKCRNRRPWYSVPDVRVPDAFLSYMSGEGPQLVANSAGCSCTNSVHAVSLNRNRDLDSLNQMWEHPLTRLSCEIEGHPLGGGMLKLEPGECARILLPKPTLRLSAGDLDLVRRGIETMRRWRHYE